MHRVTFIAHPYNAVQSLYRLNFEVCVVSKSDPMYLLLATQCRSVTIDMPPRMLLSIRLYISNIRVDLQFFTCVLQHGVFEQPRIRNIVRRV